VVAIIELLFPTISSQPMTTVPNQQRPPYLSTQFIKIHLYFNLPSSSRYFKRRASTRFTHENPPSTCQFHRSVVYFIIITMRGDLHKSQSSSGKKSRPTDYFLQHTKRLGAVTKSYFQEKRARGTNLSFRCFRSSFRKYSANWMADLFWVLSQRTTMQLRAVICRPS
jgi:hypothetical protein